MTRLFTAIELPREQKKILYKVVEGLSGVRATPQAQLHLTLNFIGEVENSLFQKLCVDFARITAAPFVMQIHELGVFPRHGRPRILWAGVSPSQPLTMLQQLLRQHLMSAGIEQRDKVFHPHITLARAKKISRENLKTFCASHQQLTLPTFQVTNFYLFSSKLTEKGAIHCLEQSFPLQGKTEQ